ncbi:MAG: RCC1 repeat-containing protein [Pseudomonadota bacterium]
MRIIQAWLCVIAIAAAAPGCDRILPYPDSFEPEDGTTDETGDGADFEGEDVAADPPDDVPADVQDEDAAEDPLEEEPGDDADEDPVEDSVEEDPIEDPAEEDTAADPVEEDLVEDPAEEDPAEDPMEEDIAPDPVEEDIVELDPVEEDPSVEDVEEEEIEPDCGNGEPEGEEECDDGNEINGDGCDNDCTYSCHTETQEADCDDDNPCTRQRCNTETHRCENPACCEGVDCDDGVYCTIDDKCNGEGRCVGTDADNLFGVAALAGGNNHACALLDTGGVKCWGQNNFGQLGNGTLVDSPLPVDVTGLPGPAVGLGVGREHSCVVLQSGAVACWGSNSNGKLGNNSTTNSSVPVLAEGISNALAVAAGEYQTCALDDPDDDGLGGVKCWGTNDKGQVGDGTNDNRLVPTQVIGLDDGFQALDTGFKHSCAASSTAGVKCWGLNSNDQLGDASGTDSNVPVDVAGLSGTAADVKTGYYHNCALNEAGAVQCWGSGGFGQLGNGSMFGSAVPVFVSGLSSGVSSIATGHQFTCALVSGGVRCWGNSQNGYMGDGRTVNSSTPVTVYGLGTGVDSIWGGDYGTFAITDDGTVKAWGRNDYGMMGDGTVDKVVRPGDIPGLTSGAAALGVAMDYACAVTTAGGIKCWGNNISGQLGDGTGLNSIGTVDVSGLVGTAVQVRGGGGHTCALMNTGGLKCWGSGGHGQLGNGATESQPFPVDVTGLTSAVIAVSTGANFSCAIYDPDADAVGTVKCWGLNSTGQLGNGLSVGSTTPVDATDLTDATAISSGNSHSCAVTLSGGVKCWGWNAYGQLGDGSTANSNVPVAVTGLASSAVAIAAGDYHSCAILDTHQAQCWGRNNSGQLGNGESGDSTVPVTVTPLTDAGNSIAAGDSHTCCLTTGGGARCWGYNQMAALGDGTLSTSRNPVNVFGLGSGAASIGAGENLSCALLDSGGVKCWGYDDNGQVTTDFNGYPHDVLCD